MQDKIIVFQNKKIRRIWHEEEWYFSVVDVVSVLTESKDDLTARKYWNKLAQRLRAEGSESVTNCHQLKLEANDGKKYATDCANTQTLFRIIQSEKDFAILTSEISKATFGITPSEYKELKGLKKKNQNFRDHMTDLELIFTMLGEKVTTEISK
ncbi:MAG TPA: BRO family protein, partial [Leptospiraceae bacterium]|nr:BRO family protein [Leptospiraceae bacterium]